MYSLDSIQKREAAAKKQPPKGTGFVTEQGRRTIQKDLGARFDALDKALNADDWNAFQEHADSLCVQLGILRMLSDSIRKVS